MCHLFKRVNALVDFSRLDIPANRDPNKLWEVPTFVK